MTVQDKAELQAEGYRVVIDSRHFCHVALAGQAIGVEHGRDYVIAYYYTPAEAWLAALSHANW